MSVDPDRGRDLRMQYCKCLRSEVRSNIRVGVGSGLGVEYIVKECSARRKEHPVTARWYILGMINYNNNMTCMEIKIGTRT